ncbi:Cupin 2 conserved barrel domain protein [Methanosalsum zhilinae DSM 4017]|uniref:Cupin 2 conserved barrel domain protein n=1 Tax=Methanosalsum zhilinae (strain DSM 4017 / NBRC 107636 / OCM 62 / WeN5) TaxID=679901 RepID=F7XKD2_METZD|nr:cupin domain-containing protein [Methanosalsum zhilinae]AEH61700.1 Cupin 2 conserved barrel domain protein [Methanosalsum zhilinae DSM 4017]
MTSKEGYSKNLNEIMQFPEEGIFSTVLAKSDNSNYTLMCLSSGTDIETHTSTRSGTVYVLKGTGTFRLYDEDIQLEPGVFIYMPANAPHSIRAHEDLAVLISLTD